jgi:hypothetical protein
VNNINVIALSSSWYATFPVYQKGVGTLRFGTSVSRIDAAAIEVGRDLSGKRDETQMREQKRGAGGCLAG